MPFKFYALNKGKHLAEVINIFLNRNATQNNRTELNPDSSSMILLENKQWFNNTYKYENLSEDISVGEI